MDNRNNGGPAFPQHGWTNNPEVLERMKDQGGMSLRDWFAGMAMQGLLSSDQLPELIQSVFGNRFQDCEGPEPIAELSMQMADAMLAAREEVAK